MYTQGEVYALAHKLFDAAEVWMASERREDTRAHWNKTEKAEALLKEYKFAEAEALCREVFLQNQRRILPFNIMITAIIRQNELQRALAEVEAEEAWLLMHPYKILTYLEGIGEVERDETHYMHEWIMAMNTMTAHEKDLEGKIAKGYVYKPRKRS